MTSYCDHLEAAADAIANDDKAEEFVIKKEKLDMLKLEKGDLEMLSRANVDGELKVYILPDNNLAVPSLYDRSHENPLDFLHIKNLKCPLSKCHDKRAKVHTLLKKEGPICLHTLLAYCVKDQLNNQGKGSKFKNIK